MVTITDGALENFREILKKEGKEGWGLRLFIYGGGWSTSYGLDFAEGPLEGDQVVENGDVRLFIDSYTYNMIGDVEIDYVKDGAVEGFVMKGSHRSCCS